MSICPKCGKERASGAMGAGGPNITASNTKAKAQYGASSGQSVFQKVGPAGAKKPSIEVVATAPSAESKLKEFADAVLSHLYVRHAEKLTGAPVNQQALFNWFSFDKKWSSYLDVYKAYPPIPGVSWNDAIMGTQSVPEWKGSFCGGHAPDAFRGTPMCAQLLPQLFDMAWRLCSMKATDEYMGAKATHEPKVTIPALSQQQMVALGPIAQAGRLDVIAQNMAIRIGVTSSGKGIAQAPLLSWIFNQKHWNNYHDMYKKYGDWETWVTQTAAAAMIMMKGSPSTIENVLGYNFPALYQQFTDDAASAWYNDLIYPLCIEQAVDEFLQYVASLMP